MGCQDSGSRAGARKWNPTLLHTGETRHLPHFLPGCRAVPGLQSDSGSALGWRNVPIGKMEGTVLSAQRALICTDQPCEWVQAGLCLDICDQFCTMCRVRRLFFPEISRLPLCCALLTVLSQLVEAPVAQLLRVSTKLGVPLPARHLPRHRTRYRLLSIDPL